MPGVTGWADSIYQLRPVFLYIDIPHNEKCRFGDCGVWSWNYHLNGKSYDGILFGKQDTLYSVYIDGDYDSAISLSHLFETYGQPSQVFTQASPYNAGDPPSLRVIILYKQFKFIVQYTWWANLRNEELVACGQPALFKLGIVAIDENQWTTTELAENGIQTTKAGISIWGAKPISDVTSFTNTTWYTQVVRDPSGTCISTPLKYWY
jgi:hypothetical protein